MASGQEAASKSNVTNLDRFARIKGDTYLRSQTNDYAITQPSGIVWCQALRNVAQSENTLSASPVTL
jgi:hypothetical protein